MATLPNFPAIRPSLLLDFINGPVDPRISCGRNTPGWRYGPSGLLEMVPAGALRIDYDPVTRARLGLLIEEQRTNLMPQSEFATGLAGTNQGGAVSASTLGGFSGGILFQQSANAAFVYKTPSTTVGTAYAFSIFVSMEDGGAPIVTANNTLGDFSLVLNNGTVAGVVSRVGASLYRVTGVVTASSTTTNWGVVKYTGQSSRAFRVTGYDLQAGAFPTSYIPTTTAAVTRAADLAQMTGSNFTDWYRQDEGTFVVEGSSHAIAASSMMAVSDGTSNNFSKFRFASSSNVSAVSQFIGVTGGVAQWGISGLGTATADQIAKIAGAYKLNNVNAAKNGVLGVEDLSASMPPVNTLRIGVAESGSVEFLNGHIRRILYYPQRLTNAQLQALTAP